MIKSWDYYISRTKNFDSLCSLTHWFVWKRRDFQALNRCTRVQRAWWLKHTLTSAAGSVFFHHRHHHHHNRALKLTYMTDTRLKKFTEAKSSFFSRWKWNKCWRFERRTTTESGRTSEKPMLCAEQTNEGGAENSFVRVTNGRMRWKQGGKSSRYLQRAIKYVPLADLKRLTMLSQ